MEGGDPEKSSIAKAKEIIMVIDCLALFMLALIGLWARTVQYPPPL